MAKSPEEALREVAQTDGPNLKKGKTIGGEAKTPSTPQGGYEKLGPATDPRAGKQRIK